MQNDLLKNKVAIITGASRGIGESIAISFAKAKANLVLVSLQDQNKLFSVKNRIEKMGSKVLVFNGDVSSSNFCTTIVNDTIKSFNQIDILVNCAGIIDRSSFDTMEHKDWSRVLDVNLNGSLYMSKEVIKLMKNRNYGKIINITSQMAFIPHPSASPSYEVSKSGLTALTRHLALNYAKNNICVNAIAPGSIDTDMPKSMSSKARDEIKKGIPMKRLGEPEEISNCALFLASELSSYITGSTIHINGGSLMR